MAKSAHRHGSRSYAVWAVSQRLLAGALLLLLAPVFMLLYPAVRLSSPGPFLYSQMRPGRNGVPFRAYKLRTMRVGADRNTEAARSVRSGDPMVTPLGRILRRLKIDEAPAALQCRSGRHGAGRSPPDRAQLPAGTGSQDPRLLGAPCGHARASAAFRRSACSKASRPSRSWRTGAAASAWSVTTSPTRAWPTISSSLA